MALFRSVYADLLEPVGTALAKLKYNSHSPSPKE